MSLIKFFFISVSIQIFAFAAQAQPFSCTCDMQYEKQTGKLYTERVWVLCPKGERADLTCEGEESIAGVTTVCTNRVNGEYTTAQSSIEPDGVPTSVFPTCRLH